MPGLRHIELYECESCHRSIPGFHWGAGVAHSPGVPDYCIGSGTAYPWTFAKLQAIDELIFELELDSEDQATLSASVRDLATNNPRSELGLTHFKRLAKKAGENIGGSLYKNDGGRC